MEFKDKKNRTIKSIILEYCIRRYIEDPNIDFSVIEVAKGADISYSYAGYVINKMKKEGIFEVKNERKNLFKRFSISGKIIHKWTVEYLTFCMRNDII